jgi:hypothetical protein
MTGGWVSCGPVDEEVKRVSRTIDRVRQGVDKFSDPWCDNIILLGDLAINSSTVPSGLAHLFTETVQS